MITKLIPKKVFFTSGAGTHPEKLESFEVALRDACIEKFNLVTVSSILPPRCEIVTKEEGLKELSPGEIVFCVMSRISSNDPGTTLTSSVGCALPVDISKHGYISEYHAYEESAQDAGAHAVKLAESMYSTWTKEEPLKTFSIPRSSTVKDSGDWMTVISAAVFVI
ncbi:MULTISPECIES: pyruvoyl-dependent arginine decarboxylase [Methanosarcina]|jgi:arginine decarboxylase|uniref:Pyruvoyl-dependent arginine decarboxylase n=3 Tax=Methanosarcina mazei TaxID=2209 RepID=A0A0F8T9U5_METMZ|nr:MULTISPECIES: arginine decarboxylase, pyruvoyl-dependent [Methanosarcina]AGF95738.1 Pyruvoyl-dependent arginine decarboxylase [Methanosarcina mazei Tuc01]AKB39993.1 Pyruvoyl-dependent arginine decarboxylase [Methanosarcina mazei WWM610]KKF97768.1 pyruvoyl-dependent arginine decarboxylase [Methanosarcina mazei]KKG05138.1 pyruvoyl-dependent arginine decarboxylase [Methanosarcina mazei]KKG13687.1 pyruvoyl-dependent arginine decarboxylase [Methanosarcina mazei]